MDELKSCPFCGGATKFYQFSYGTTDKNSVCIRFRLECSKCGATAPKANGDISINLGANGELNCWQDDRKRAVDAWNRRA